VRPPTPPVDPAALSALAPFLAGGLAVLLIGMLGILVLVARRADLIRAIEESGAFATLHGVRHLALTAPTVYRDLRRRYRMARHRPLRLVPAIGEGWAAPVSRSAVTHLRRWRDASRLLTVGLVLAPLGSVALTGGPHPVTLLVWGLLCIMSHGAVAELAGAFREDMRVRLVRDALPFSTRSLALLDGLVPTGAAVALFMLYLAAGALAVPGTASAPRRRLRPSAHRLLLVGGDPRRDRGSGGAAPSLHGGGRLGNRGGRGRAVVRRPRSGLPGAPHRRGDHVRHAGEGCVGGKALSIPCAERGTTGA